MVADLNCGINPNSGYWLHFRKFYQMEAMIIIPNEINYHSSELKSSWLTFFYKKRIILFGNILNNMYICQK
jgi:hypothetical protein